MPASPLREEENTDGIRASNGAVLLRTDPSTGEFIVSDRDEFDLADTYRNGTVTVYVDPFYPAEGSLSGVRTPVPEILQYGGAVVVSLGLVVLARMARRVSA